LNREKFLPQRELPRKITQIIHRVFINLSLCGSPGIISVFFLCGKKMLPN